MMHLVLLFSNGLLEARRAIYGFGEKKQAFAAAKAYA
jgi:hypothetical protein